MLSALGQRLGAVSRLGSLGAVTPRRCAAAVGGRRSAAESRSSGSSGSNRGQCRCMASAVVTSPGGEAEERREEDNGSVVIPPTSSPSVPSAPKASERWRGKGGMLDSPNPWFYPHTHAVVPQTIPGDKVSIEVRSYTGPDTERRYPNLHGMNPLTFKVKLKVFLHDLNLSQAAEARLRLLVGPRLIEHKAHRGAEAKWVLQLITDRYPNRISNKRYLLNLMENVLIEARKADDAEYMKWEEEEERKMEQHAMEERRAKEEEEDAIVDDIEAILESEVTPARAPAGVAADKPGGRDR